MRESENAEEFRQKGELLTTFMAQVPRGAGEVELANYYDENKPIKIALDPALTPQPERAKIFPALSKAEKCCQTDSSANC